MAYKIPTTQELTDQNITEFEAKLNQTSPLNDRAFIRVLSAIEAAIGTGLYKLGAERAQQNLVLTATGDDLDILGANYNIFRLPAESAQFTAEITGTDGTIIPITTEFIGQANGERYVMTEQAIIALGVASLSLSALNPGIAGNLDVGGILNISSPIAGAASFATITFVDNIGTERETDENYRQRIQDFIRTVPGGGGAADYRNAAQTVAGVRRAFPFSGVPIGEGITLVPPMRTVYIQVTPDIEPDGIAPQPILDEVKDAITNPLGIPSETLYIRSIALINIHVTISGLVVDPALDAQAKADIEAAILLYLDNVIIFVQGLDAEIDRNDTITDVSIGRVIQDVVSTYGGYVGGVIFGFVSGGDETSYTLANNQVPKLIEVVYVA